MWNFVFLTPVSLIISNVTVHLNLSPHAIKSLPYSPFSPLQRTASSDSWMPMQYSFYLFIHVITFIWNFLFNNRNTQKSLKKMQKVWFYEISFRHLKTYSNIFHIFSLSYLQKGQFSTLLQIINQKFISSLKNSKKCVFRKH